MKNKNATRASEAHLKRARKQLTVNEYGTAGIHCENPFDYSHIAIGVKQLALAELLTWPDAPSEELVAAIAVSGRRHYDSSVKPAREYLAGENKKGLKVKRLIGVIGGSCYIPSCRAPRGAWYLHQGYGKYICYRCAVATLRNRQYGVVLGPTTDFTEELKKTMKYWDVDPVSNTNAILHF